MQKIPSSYEALFYGLTTGAITGVVVFSLIFSSERAERRAANMIYDTVFQHCAIEALKRPVVDLVDCVNQAQAASEEARRQL